MHIHLSQLLRAGFATALIAAVAACGGGGGGGDAAPGATNPAGKTAMEGSGTITGFGSVIVNGIRFDDSSAAVLDEDGNPRSRDSLRLGMTVEIKGVSDDTTGQATEITVVSEVRGAVQAVDAGAGTLKVLDVNVQTSADTAYEGVAGLADIKVGDVVEVYGIFDRSTGVLAATRIEKKDPAAPFKLKAKGIVRNLDTGAKTFELGTGADAIVIDYSHANLKNLDKSGLAEGVWVMVTSTQKPAAGVWVVDEVKGIHFIPPAATTVTEGLVSDYVSTSSFKVNGLPVDASHARIAGHAEDLKDGARVIVIGKAENGVIQAKVLVVVRAKDRFDPLGIELHGLITDFVSVSDFKLRGESIDASGATFENGTSADLANGKRVEVRGRIDGSIVRATRVKFED